MSIQPVGLDLLEFDLPDRMRRALRVSGVSVNQMAEYLGVKPETCSRYINGRANPPLQTVRLWALRTGFPFVWLKDGEIPAGPTDPDGDALTSTTASTPSR